MNSAIIFWRSEAALGAMFKITKRKVPRPTAQSLLGCVGTVQYICFLAILFFFSTKNTFTLFLSNKKIALKHVLVGLFPKMIMMLYFVVHGLIQFGKSHFLRVLPPPHPPQTFSVVLDLSSWRGWGVPQNYPWALRTILQIPQTSVCLRFLCLNVCVCGRGM